MRDDGGGLFCSHIISIFSRFKLAAANLGDFALVVKGIESAGGDFAYLAGVCKYISLIECLSYLRRFASGNRAKAKRPAANLADFACVFHDIAVSTIRAIAKRICGDIPASDALDCGIFGVAKFSNARAIFNLSHARARRVAKRGYANAICARPAADGSDGVVIRQLIDTNGTSRACDVANRAVIDKNRKLPARDGRHIAASVV